MKNKQGKVENPNRTLKKQSISLLCPLCGRRITVANPRCWKICSSDSYGMHLLMILKEGNKVTIEVAWDGKRTKPAD